EGSPPAWPSGTRWAPRRRAAGGSRDRRAHLPPRPRRHPGTPRPPRPRRAAVGPRAGEPRAVLGIDERTSARGNDGIGQRAGLGDGVALERAERRLAVVGEDHRHAPSRLRFDETVRVDERASERACESSSHFRLSRAHEAREDEVRHVVTRASAPATLLPEPLRRRQRRGARLDHLRREEYEELLVVRLLEAALEEP